eukprot:CAMPEP_0117658404 /NCGR_PEP_ID=MMETSP0804-20121206/5846_1 /TAXON_ID=1074897 /ORGANISM="Tetraselmis astigmatica, Strain CCMP880" /LENGTH=61 /DNA_ID=CAMNT_0005464923 /DNA_START=154 /DNA_END=339 /DNA_ORIENTATION=+
MRSAKDSETAKLLMFDGQAQGLIFLPSPAHGRHRAGPYRAAWEDSGQAQASAHAVPPGPRM